MFIFIHGMWATPDIWHPFIHYFSERGIECTAVNLREGLDMRTARFQDYVEKVAAIARDEDVLIGHSMGGLIVQKVAECSTIRAGVAIAPAPPKGIAFRKSALLSSVRYLPHVILRKPFKPGYHFLKKLVFSCLDDEEARKMYGELEEEPPTVSYEIALSRIAVDETRVKCPLLFIAKEDDAVIPPEMVKTMAAKYRAEYRVFSGCHVILDEWKDIAEEIHRFINK